MKHWETKLVHIYIKEEKNTFMYVQFDMLNEQNQKLIAYHWKNYILLCPIYGKMGVHLLNKKTDKHDYQIHSGFANISLLFKVEKFDSISYFPYGKRGFSSKQKNKQTILERLSRLGIQSEKCEREKLFYEELV